MLTPSRVICGVGRRAVAAAPLLLCTLLAQATLVRTDNSAFANLAVTGGPCPAGLTCEAQDDDPLFAQVQLGSTFATADVALGLIRSYVESSAGAAGEGSGDGTGAEITFTLTNQGSTPIALPAGALTFNVRATFSRSLGSLSGTTVAAALGYGSNPTNLASADIQYYFIDSGVPGSVILTQNTRGGAAIAVNTANATTLDLSLLSGAITVLPNEALSMSFLFQPTSNTIGVGGRALIDASQTATLGLQLPQGTLYDGNGVNTTWISVVPEVPSVALLGVGLAMLGLRHLRRQHA